MKPRIIILLVVLGAFLTSCYDESGISDAFGKYRWREGVVAFTVPGFAIRIASRVADLEKEERELLQSIDKVKVLVIDENSDSRINLHKEFYSHINTDGKYEELLVIRDHDQDVTIFGKMSENETIKEMVLLVGGDDNALIYVKGDIRPEMFSKYIKSSGPDKLLSFDF